MKAFLFENDIRKAHASLSLLVTLKFFVKVCSFAWLYIQHSSIHCYLKDTHDAKENSWALVIGASDGIGQAFAAELCQQGSGRS